MLNKAQYQALSAAVDVAYDGDAERAEMESDARSALMYLKDASEAPRPEGSRWRILNGSAKQAGILQCIKSRMSIDPHHKVVVMPAIDYDRLSTRMLALEAFYEKYQPQQEIIDYLLATEATADLEVAQPKETFVPTVTAEDTITEMPYWHCNKCGGVGQASTSKLAELQHKMKHPECNYLPAWNFKPEA